MEKNNYVSKSEVAYFLHRLVSAIERTVEDKNTREDIGMMHNDIYMFLEKPNP